MFQLFQIQHVITDSNLSLDHIGQMRDLAVVLNKLSEGLNVSDLDSRTVHLLKTTDLLHRSVDNQNRLFQNYFADLRKDFSIQNENIESVMLAR